MTLGEVGITSYDCTCPVDGRCKHLVALLLTWIDAADEVPRTEPLENRLRAQSTDTLVDVIMDMIQRHPDLSMLAEMAADSGTDADPDRIRGQIRSTFQDATNAYRDYDNPYRAAVSVYRDLDLFIDKGKQLADAGQTNDAASVLCAFIEEGCEHYTRLPDREGRIAALFDDATERLNVMLAEAEDSDLRASILRTLTDLVLADIDFGGYGLGDYPRHVVLDHATADERRALAEHVRTALMETINDVDVEEESLQNPGFGWIGSWDVSTWKAEALGGFLLALEEDQLDDEAYLALCEKTGRHRDRTERLFELGRREDAQDLARDLPDLDLCKVADVFEEHDAADLLRVVVDERLDKDTDPRLVEWRRDDALEQEDQETALELTKRIFWRRYNDIQEYETLRSIAQDLGRWDEVKEEVHAKARKQTMKDMLARLHLSDGDLAEAVDLATRDAISRGLQMQIAGTAADEYPEDAIDLYERQARRLIKQRGRGNYAQAAKEMERAKALYMSLGYDELWVDTIEKLVDDELHRLPAARDEFQKAGLL